MPNNMLSIKITLLILILLSSAVAYAGSNNTVGVVKKPQSGYTAVSIENIGNPGSTKIRKSIIKNEPAKQPAKQIKKSSTTINTKTIHLKKSPNSPTVINKTGQFVFRNVTQNKTETVAEKSLQTRTSKIDFLRKQLKGY